jgi:hypothetical protein
MAILGVGRARPGLALLRPDRRGGDQECKHTGRYDGFHEPTPQQPADLTSSTAFGSRGGKPTDVHADGDL